RAGAVSVQGAPLGFITEKLSGRAKSPLSAAHEDSRRMWREAFGAAATLKEEGLTTPRRPPATHTGRSLAGAGAFQRLLQAFRSRAPGGWSDDRWEQSRHYTGIQYVALHRCAEQFQQGEFQVFKRDPSHPEGKRPVTKHDPPEGGRHTRPYELVELLEKPNPQDSFGDLAYMWYQQMGLTGSALTWMVPNALGAPYELYSIPTALAVPQPVINPDYPEGYYRIQPVYPYGPFSSYPTPASAVGAPIPAQWVMKFKYPHPFLRHDGYSPLTALRYHIDLLEMIDRSRHYSMRRSINPSAVVNFEDMDGAQPLPEEEIERIRAEFEEDQMGPENAGRLYVSPPGGKLEQWGSRPIDMDYPRGWDQLTSYILGGFGITKPAAGMIEDSSYSTLFATMKQLHWQTLDPMCQRISSQITRTLAPFFGDDLIVEVRCKRIDDHDVKNALLQILMAGKAVTKNELRKECGFGVTSEDWGSEIATMMAEDEIASGGKTGNLGILTEGGDGFSGSRTSAERLLPAEVSASRPDPGRMGLGALGSYDQVGMSRKPAEGRLGKHLDGAADKSFYDRVREVMRNGH
ncbi:MAG TPA: phage portal protein, partial [Salinarimonas sp.]|nr:phage portal protein [Salinarimonas sp.]